MAVGGSAECYTPRLGGPVLIDEDAGVLGGRCGSTRLGGGHDIIGRSGIGDNNVETLQLFLLSGLTWATSLIS